MQLSFGWQSPVGLCDILMQSQRGITVSLKGSQLYTLNPELMPQEKQVLSWLNPMCRSSNLSFLLSDGRAMILEDPGHTDPSQPEDQTRNV